jgi:hypothetical protein
MSRRRASAHGEPQSCQNCGTALRGEFCHACGQSVHNPVRHAAHALEDIAESFWHLDGRVFQTLRDLLLPGRVASRYLAGHRVRYVAPLRLFLVLSVLAFLVADFAMQSATHADPARTPPLVVLDKEPGTQGDPAVDQMLQATEVEGLPTFANEWLKAKAQRIRANLPRISDDPALLTHAYLSAVPKALFVLVPLFALLLKLAYVRSGRLYLEHLVVALYSHAWICLSVLTISALSVLAGWLSPHAGWMASVLGFFNTLLLWMIPAYLLFMQKVVYRDPWGRTLVKFFAFGGLYTAIVGVAALILVLLSLASV